MAITEEERDVNSDRILTFNIDRKWFNQSLSGVPDSILWKCIEKSSSPYMKGIFGTLIGVLGLVIIFYAVIKLIMVFVNYKRVQKLIDVYYGTKMHSNSQNGSNFTSIMIIIIVLHEFFQLRQLENQSLNQIKRILMKNWQHPNVSASSLRRWKIVLFLIPVTEFILILILFLLVLTSYNVHPIGCFFVEVNYDVSTNMVMLEFTEGVRQYQQVAVIAGIIVFIMLAIIKCYLIHHILKYRTHILKYYAPTVYDL